MDFDYNTTMETHIFFSKFYEFDNLGIFYSTFIVSCQIISAFLILSVSWYEKYSEDMSYRTVLNQLAVAAIKVNLFANIVLTCCTLIVINFGPFPLEIYGTPHMTYGYFTCNLMIAGDQFLIICNLIQGTTYGFFKYFLIVPLMRMESFDDDFVSFFLTSITILLSLLFIGTNFMLGINNYDIDFHICTGLSPQQNIDTFQYAYSITGNITSKNNLKYPLETCNPIQILIMFLLYICTAMQIVKSVKHRLHRMDLKIVLKKKILPSLCRRDKTLPSTTTTMPTLENDVIIGNDRIIVMLVFVPMLLGLILVYKHTALQHSFYTL